MGNTSLFDLGPERLNELLSIGREEPEAGDAPQPEPVDGVCPSDAPGETPGARIGRCRLLKVLGEGGMGIVYLAEQEQPIQRQVALKVIKPGMDSKRVIARFEGWPSWIIPTLRISMMPG